MANRLLPARWPGQTPPGGQALEINPWHPLAPGLLGVWVFGRGTPVNLVTGAPATVFGAAGVTVGPTGPAFTSNASARIGWQLRADRLLTNRLTWTVASVVSVPTTATTLFQGRPIYAERHPSTGNDILKLQMQESGSALQFVYRNSAGNLRIQSGSGDIRTGRAMVAALSLAPGGSSGSAGRIFQGYKDGALNISWDWGTTSTAQTQTNVATVGYDARDANARWFGDISLVVTSEHGWSAEEHALFARDPWSILRPAAPILLGIAPVGGGPTAYTLAVTPASLVLTPQAVGLRVARRLSVQPAAIAVTPQAVALRAARRLAVQPAALTVSAQAVGLRAGRRLGIAAAAVVLTPQTIGLRATRRLPVAPAAIALTPQDVALRYSGGVTIEVGAAAIAVTPQAVGLRVTRRLVVAPAAIALTPQIVALRATRRLAVTAAQLVLTAQAVGLRRGRLETPVRTAIIDAVVAALTAASISIRGAPVTIARSRTDMIEAAERPMLVVLGGDMIAQSEASDTLYQRYSLRIILAGYLAAATEADAENDAAELHARVVRALIRPDPAALPVSLLLSDNLTEVWLQEGSLVIEPASVVQSEDPAASCLVEMTADVRQPWGNLFISG